MPQNLIEETSFLMEETLDHLTKEFGKIRTGRANPAMVDSVKVEVYGMLTPLNQVASITTPEARQLLITPFDRTQINVIEGAIRDLNLSVSLSNDGNNIRLVISPLTEETRKKAVKDMKNVAEQAKIGVRNKRRDANDKLKKMQKNSDITEDELKFYLDQVQKETDNFIAKVDSMAKEKEEVIMKV